MSWDVTRWVGRSLAFAGHESEVGTQRKTVLASMHVNVCHFRNDCVTLPTQTRIGESMDEIS